MTTQAQHLAPATFPPRWATVAAYGVVLWVVFLLLIRNFGAFLFVPGSVQLLLSFALLVPVAALAVRSLALFGVKDSEALLGLTIATIPALMLDAIAFTWTTWYGPAAQTGAAFILWGVGWTYIFALMQQRSAR